MTATQDLIAAALMLADEFDSDLERPTPQAAEVREMCARAMVQPVGELPIPAYDGYDMIDRFIRNNLDDDDYAEYLSGLHEYGDAREAAGYAAGVADGKQDAAVDCSTCQYASPTRHELCNGCEQTVTVFRNYKRASWAALRGEVKP